MDNKKNKKRGRPKGSENRVSAASKDILLDLFEEYRDIGQLKEDFFDLPTGKDRLEILVKLLPYIRPKLSAIEHSAKEPMNSNIADILKKLAEECE